MVKRFSSGRPNFALASKLVVTATKCLAIASIEQVRSRNQLRADCALTWVSSVVKDFDAIMKRVVSGLTALNIG